MMGSGKQLLLVFLIAQFAGYGIGLQCHTCNATYWDLFETSPCLDDTLLHAQGVNPVECTIENAINYDQLKNRTWNVEEDLQLGCGKIEFRISRGLLWIQRGCYIQVIKAKTSENWTEYVIRNDMEKTISVCTSRDFCNAAPTPTFGVIAKAYSIFLGMIVSLVL